MYVEKRNIFGFQESIVRRHRKSEPIYEYSIDVNIVTFEIAAQMNFSIIVIRWILIDWAEECDVDVNTNWTNTGTH